MFRTGFERPEKCFQCGRCTSGCSISKIVGDYRPSRIVALAGHGLAERALDGNLWYCARCLKCVEYCPQGVAPADVVSDLQHLAVSRGLKFPEAYGEMLRSLCETSLAFKPVEFTDRDFEVCTRASMGLPPLATGEGWRRASEIVAKIEKGEL
jgi:heterodisulfide reductase subunit C